MLVSLFVLYIVLQKRRLCFTEKTESSFFHLNPEILTRLFNLIYYLILTPTLTLIPQLRPNPNRKPHIKCARMIITQCSFSLCKIIFQVK